MTTAGEWEPDSELIDDLFHALSQPLTSLRCCTEVALLEPRTCAEYCEVLEHSLELSEKISDLVAGIRELWDSQGSNRFGEWISLQQCLNDIVGDLAPVAQAEGKVLLLSSVPSETKVEGPQTGRALTVMIQHAMSICAKGETIKVDAQEAAIRIAVSRRISDPRSENETVILRRRLGMAIARRSLESAGCRCREQLQSEAWHYEVLLPAEWERRSQGCGKVFPFSTQI